jgi:hypothetical protein
MHLTKLLTRSNLQIGLSQAGRTTLGYSITVVCTKDSFEYEYDSVRSTSGGCVEQGSVWCWLHNLTPGRDSQTSSRPGLEAYYWFPAARISLLNFH